ncbi:pyridoxamine 5'-phosphate oxidase family protein [Actinomadura kijaniata]|uniref:pyridoxamine 5'-phosphate oxidase family protein n=1 Tax=Actinomadura kijaniata TaxID=46161 RepID=UPI0008365E3C|nr:PPOX class F420-dependent oxidoreductase [Actinomadura kijaniata]
MSENESGPAPRALTEDELVKILGEQQFGTLATVKKSGHPHLATVLYRWDPAERVVRISTLEDRIKTRHLRRDPRVALHINGGNVWSFAVVEGDAEVSAEAAELVAFAGGFEDPAEERAHLERMAAERRVVIRITADRLYGTALDIPGE